MRTRKAALAIAILALGIGPWMALPAGTVILDATPAFAPMSFGMPSGIGPFTPRQIARAAARAHAPTGCSCREITVNAKNVVRDADVRSGDAEVINKSITYIAPTYGDDDVDVEQTADARSGDAIAGQILGIAASGGGCSRIHVTATNDVADSDVRSGDAVAKNKSIILLDPSIDRSDLDIDVDQRADARSGNAIAGQIIGIAGGGGPCGGVVLDALNRVSNTDVRSGDATMKNSSEILTCDNSGCLKEIRGALSDVATVSVCDGEFCHPVPTKDFVQMLKDSFEPTPTPTPGEASTSSDDADADTVPDIPTIAPKRHRHHRSDPEPTPTPTPTPSPTPDGVMQAQG